MDITQDSNNNSKFHSPDFSVSVETASANDLPEMKGGSDIVVSDIVTINGLGKKDFMCSL